MNNKQRMRMLDLDRAADSPIEAQRHFMLHAEGIARRVGEIAQ